MTVDKLAQDPKLRNNPIINREISWLSFNDRVLQEAHDPTVPLIERFRFMGIFSNNLDEFFRVRVASLSRMLSLDKKEKRLLGYNPNKILKDIKKIVLKQQSVFEKLYSEVLIPELASQKVFIINESQLNVSRGSFVNDYFKEKILPSLNPIMIEKEKPFPYLKDRSIYLLIKLYNREDPGNFKLSLIEIPTDTHSRFIILPNTNNLKFLILLDDVIRYCLDEIFKIFNYSDYDSYTIKMTRDAEIDFDINDMRSDMLESFKKNLKQRKKGKPVRFVYDHLIPRDLLVFLKNKMNLLPDNLIPGGRYHNFKDFINFPDVGLSSLEYPSNPPLEIEHLNRVHSMFAEISRSDQMIHLPYQKFDYVIRFLRESAIDPKVESIKITLYRISENSMIGNALINAARNGKKVTVIMELKARFDEENNLNWTHKLVEEGVIVHHGFEDIKIHSKIAVVSRKENGKSKLYTVTSTGNYNEKTSRIYGDHTLFTADKRITSEVNKVFIQLEKGVIRGTYKHILVSPLNLRTRIENHIIEETEKALSGKKAFIFFKLNSLVDTDIIELLYKASQAGVRIRIIVRGICCLVPGVKDLSENIEIISIIDRYLEHARVFLFGNGVSEMMFISSADLMVRNLDMRVEVAVPVYKKEIREEVKLMMEMQWKDNTKARLINPDQNNTYKNVRGNTHRSQIEIYQYLKDK